MNIDRASNYSVEINFFCFASSKQWTNNVDTHNLRRPIVKTIYILDGNALTHRDRYGIELFFGYADYALYDPFMRFCVSLYTIYMTAYFRYVSSININWVNAALKSTLKRVNHSHSDTSNIVHIIFSKHASLDQRNVNIQIYLYRVRQKQRARDRSYHITQSPAQYNHQYSIEHVPRRTDSVYLYKKNMLVLIAKITGPRRALF